MAKDPAFNKIAAKLARLGMSPTEINAFGIFADLFLDAADGVIRDMNDEFVNDFVKAFKQRPNGDTLKAISEAALDSIRNNADTLARLRTQDELLALGETIADGLDRQLSPRDIARNLDMVADLDSVRAKRLRNYRAELEERGLSGDELENMVELERQRLLKQRREVIVTTESQIANGNMAKEAALQRGAKMKVWLTSSDSRVSDACQKNEAAGPIPIDESFPSGDDHEPQHVNCRCKVGYLTSDAAIESARVMTEQRVALTKAKKAAANAA